MGSTRKERCCHNPFQAQRRTRMVGTAVADTMARQEPTPRTKPCAICFLAAYAE